MPQSSYENALIEAARPLIGTTGFSRPMLYAAGASMGLGRDACDLICPNGGSDLAALIWRAGDTALKAAMTPERLDGLKIRDKIALLVHTRLHALCADAPVGERLTGHLALPAQVVLGQRLIWDSADLIWQLAGDQALDENHYSKRLIVSGILASGALTWLFQGEAAFESQLGHHIDQVMRFEKFKAKFNFRPEQALLDLAGKLGALRFGRAA